jgi:hypothetical protein
MMPQIKAANLNDPAWGHDRVNGKARDCDHDRAHGHDRVSDYATYSKFR